MSDKLHRVLVKAWIQKDDKFLLARRGPTEKHMTGTWSLPGGNVEKLETDFVIEDTLKKEIWEEVGVNIEDKIELIYNNGFVRDADKSHVVNLTFLCQWKNGEAKPLQDTSEVRWFSLKELKKLDKPEFLERELKFLEEYLKI